jgi:quinol monooxygenase YgiN
MAELASISVTARFLANSGKEEQVKQTLLDMVAPTHQEAANISYDLFRANDQPAISILEEHWRSQQGLAHHMQARHFQAMEAAMANLLAEHHTVDVTQKISPQATQA